MHAINVTLWEMFKRKMRAPYFILLQQVWCPQFATKSAY